MKVLWIFFLGIILGMFLSFYASLSTSINSHKIVTSLSTFTLESIHPQVVHLLSKYENISLIDKQTCNECVQKLEGISEQLREITKLIILAKNSSTLSLSPTLSPSFSSYSPSLSPSLSSSSPSLSSSSPSLQPSSSSPSLSPTLSANATTRFLR